MVKKKYIQFGHTAFFKSKKKAKKFAKKIKLE